MHRQAVRVLFALAAVAPPQFCCFRRIRVHNSSYEVPGNEFFLTRQEITAARNGKERSDLHVASGDNTIRFYANGGPIMRRMLKTLEKTGPGDFIYATFFELDTNVMLHPRRGNSEFNRDRSEASRLINVLGNATKRGATVRLTVTMGTLQAALGTTRAQCAQVIERCGPFSCIPDQRHGSPSTGSQHQKMWLIRTGDLLTAYVGSMDVALTRWDTLAHNTENSSRWRRQFEGATGAAASRRVPWHDTMYEIRGGAAEDMLTTFVARWNDPVAPTTSDEPLPPAELLPLWLPSKQVGFIGYPGRVAIQVVRTFGCDATLRHSLAGNLPPLFQNFAPHGEYSYAAAFFKALRQAKRYIFLADQFMWFDEAMAAVVEAAARDSIKYVFILTNPGLHMHLPLNIRIDIYQEILQHYQYRALFGALADKDPSGALKNKVHMFSLEGPNTDSIGNSLIYDHEKTLLIDDEFALVGSTGIERTAFTNDADLSVAVHSKEFVSGLRRKMFAEWLGLPHKHQLLSSEDSSFKEWLRQAGEGSRRVRHYMPKNDLSYHAKPLAPIVYRFLEADGRCRGDGYDHMWPASVAAGTEQVQGYLDKMREHWTEAALDQL